MTACVKCMKLCHFKGAPVYLNILDFNHMVGPEIQTHRELTASKGETKETGTNKACLDRRSPPHRVACCSLLTIFL